MNGIAPEIEKSWEKLSAAQGELEKNAWILGAWSSLCTSWSSGSLKFDKGVKILKTYIQKLSQEFCDV